METYQRSAAKVRDWMNANFDRASSCIIGPDDPRFYIKAPVLLSALGLKSKAEAVAHHVAGHFVDEQGDVTRGSAKIPLENRLYGLGWLAWGGTTVERYDLAEPLASHLAQLQDRQSGGMVIPDEDAGEQVAEVCFSGGAGMGLIAAGKVKQAQQMADRFIALWDAQPDPNRFYNRFRRDGTVVKKIASGGWDKIYDLRMDEQRPANFATVVSMMVWVGRATRDRRYFAGARRYVDYTYSHQLDPSKFGRATKFGWAMINLYKDTGDEALLVKARHLGDFLASCQSKDGLWEPRPLSSAPVHPAARLSYSSDCAMTITALANLD